MLNFTFFLHYALVLLILTAPGLLALGYLYHANRQFQAVLAARTRD